MQGESFSTQEQQILTIAMSLIKEYGCNRIYLCYNDYTKQYNFVFVEKETHRVFIVYDKWTVPMETMMRLEDNGIIKVQKSRQLAVVADKDMVKTHAFTKLLDYKFCGKALLQYTTDL